MSLKARSCTLLAAWSLLAGQSFATTVVAIVTKHGIVLCVDSKVSGSVPTTSPDAILDNPSQKSFIIGDHAAIAHAGSKAWKLVVRGGAPFLAYPFEQSIAEAKETVGAQFAIGHLAEVLRQALEEQFHDFDEKMIKTGFVTKDSISGGDYVSIYLIAGYDGDTPYVYGVYVMVDWNTNKHYLKTQLLYPAKRKNLSLFDFGVTGEIEAMKNRANPVAVEFSRFLPQEYTALRDDQDLDIDGMTKLARGLIAFQIRATPEHVGYPLVVTTILSDVPATIQTYPH